MKCPGQDTRYWDSSAIFEVKCPVCGNADEFFKDESTRKCKKCGHRVINPKKNFGCAAYCKFAEQCLGELPEGLAEEHGINLKSVESSTDAFKKRVAAEMRSYYGNNFKKIIHTNKVAEYAEKIAKEIGADMAVVLSAALLQDIGKKGSERDDKGNNTLNSEDTEACAARQILKSLNAKEELIIKVCEIISHHYPKDEESPEFLSIHDAEHIVNMEESVLNVDNSTAFTEMIHEKLLTVPGRELAKKFF